MKTADYCNLLAQPQLFKLQGTHKVLFINTQCMYIECVLDARSQTPPVESQLCMCMCVCVSL